MIACCTFFPTFVIQSACEWNPSFMPLYIVLAFYFPDALDGLDGRLLNLWRPLFLQQWCWLTLATSKFNLKKWECQVSNLGQLDPKTRLLTPVLWNWDSVTRTRQPLRPYLLSLSFVVSMLTLTLAGACLLAIIIQHHSLVTFQQGWINAVCDSHLSSTLGRSGVSSGHP